ncbi:hypothetical protein [Arthrobacter sp. GMC3]|uniref:hypothetical protein n=1 Tax=Arthrobacter sp. GMC3 TaxID=2058894 RepID=UPI0015E2B8DA|nr:hypothetical protein [Arthrobacter sp. GMC3]
MKKAKQKAVEDKKDSTNQPIVGICLTAGRSLVSHGDVMAGRVATWRVSTGQFLQQAQESLSYRGMIPSIVTTGVSSPVEHHQ